MVEKVIHWTHRRRIKKLYLEGFTREELAIMYKLPPSIITSITRGL